LTPALIRNPPQVARIIIYRNPDLNQLITVKLRKRCALKKFFCNFGLFLVPYLCRINFGLCDKKHFSDIKTVDGILFVELIIAANGGYLLIWV
jgi:hypothetical protein